jgi:hypothetical protein
MAYAAAARAAIISFDNGGRPRAFLAISLEVADTSE